LEHPFSLNRRLFAEGLGTLLLVATIVGSGIMADALSNDVAISLLGNTIATGAILFVLITIFGPVSGAHFNPAVSFVFYLRGDLAGAMALCYIIVQISGGILGTWAAHVMFEVPILQISTVERSGLGNYVSEIIATFGLVFVIVTAISQNSKSIPMLVGLYISAAYWFTASTSFANPAVAIARSLSDTFAGIRPIELLMFIPAELFGAFVAFILVRWLYRSQN
jgi:glycerol uptake facilitator-like aquaporin